MRYFTLFVTLCALIFCTSCSAGQTHDRLAYQKSSLYVEADFTIDGDTVSAALTLDAPQYDDSGRMLARNASLTVTGGIISGVGFEVSGEDIYISSGVLKIPIEDESVIRGITDIVSLFCIDGSCYHSSEGDGDLRVDTYVSGDNRVDVTMDTSCELPSAIKAVIGEREIAVDIKVIRAE